MRLLETRTDIIRAVEKLRGAIRCHRDAKGDDRCWLDDYRLWQVIDGSPRLDKLPDPEEMMRRCEEFFTHRRSETLDEISLKALRSRRDWNADIKTVLTTRQLKSELNRLQRAIARHRDISDRPRTLDDDRSLYGTLPEQLPADFRLPPREEFLGEAKAPHAGCPAFWRSHQSCPQERKCNVYKWGPCGQ